MSLSHKNKVANIICNSEKLMINPLKGRGAKLRLPVRKIIQFS